MRILLVHNFYRSAIPSGENVVFRAEADLLRAHGHDVAEFTRSNDEEIAAPLRTRAEAALFMPWNPRSAARLRDVIAAHRPDVIHVHNTFPLLSPSVVATAAASGVPVVCTLHNYRLFCAAGVLMRDGHRCTDCIDRNSALPGLIHGCYAGSRLKTLPLTITIALHRARRTWERSVQTFLAVSEYQRDQLVAAGLPANQIRVKPNFVAPPARVVPWSERENKAIFIGRLSDEKGVDTLLRAWQILGRDAPMLEVIGSGPLRAQLEAMARELGVAQSVRFLGQLPKEDTLSRLATAKLLVQPSKSPESFGLAIVEAFAAGVPVIASRVGAFPSVIADAGQLFDAEDAQELGRLVRQAFAQPQSLDEQAERGHQRHAQHYSPQATHAELMQIYASITG